MLLHTVLCIFNKRGQTQLAPGRALGWLGCRRPPPPPGQCGPGGGGAEERVAGAPTVAGVGGRREGLRISLPPAHSSHWGAAGPFPSLPGDGKCDKCLQV